MSALFRDMAGDGSKEVSGGKDLEVAVDLGVEAGAVDDGVGGKLQCHFFHRERVAEDVLGELFEVRLVLGRDRVAVVDVEAGVFPGEQDLDAFPVQGASRRQGI